ncbi:hypothetical protein P9112_000485 [Eukaryota sp. TZLM1-RC]
MLTTPVKTYLPYSVFVLYIVFSLFVDPLLALSAILALIPFLLVFFKLHSTIKNHCEELIFTRIFWSMSPFLTIVAVQQIAFSWIFDKLIPNSNNTMLFIVICLFFAFVVAALVEESSKLLCICFYSSYINGAINGSLYGISAGLAFASFENISHVTLAYKLGGVIPMMIVATIRSLTAVPLHCICGGYIGIGMAERKLASHVSLVCFVCFGYDIANIIARSLHLFSFIVSVSRALVPSLSTTRLCMYCWRWVCHGCVALWVGVEK